MEVRIEDEAAAKRVLHENYCQTTGFSDQARHYQPATEALIDAAGACPACGALAQFGQRQCADCGIRLA